MGNIFCKKDVLYDSYRLLDDGEKNELISSFNNSKGDIEYLKNRVCNIEDNMNDNIKTLSDDIHHLHKMVKELKAIVNNDE